MIQVTKNQKDYVDRYNIY